MDVDALTNADVVVGIDDTMSEGKSISMDRSVAIREINVLAFLQSRSSQATGDITFNTMGKAAAEKPSDAMADVGGESVYRESFQVVKSGAWSHGSMIPSSVVDDADMVAHLTHFQEIHAESKKFLARRAGNQKLYMDTLLSLCGEQKKSSTLEFRVEELT